MDITKQIVAFVQQYGGERVILTENYFSLNGKRAFQHEVMIALVHYPDMIVGIPKHWALTLQVWDHHPVGYAEQISKRELKLEKRKDIKGFCQIKWFATDSLPKSGWYVLNGAKSRIGLLCFKKKIDKRLVSMSRYKPFTSFHARQWWCKGDYVAPIGQGAYHQAYTTLPKYKAKKHCITKAYLEKVQQNEAWYVDAIQFFEWKNGAYQLRKNVEVR